MTIQELMEKDNTFTESGFISKVDNTFIMLLSGIMMWDLERVKHKISDELFERYKVMVDSLKNNNERRMFDEMNVRSTAIQTISEDDENYTIVVLLESTYMDYIMNVETNKYISGVNDHRITKYHNMTFKKKKNSKDSNGVNECPNCGASVDINNNGICEFCHTVFNLEDYDWILVNIS